MASACWWLQGLFMLWRKYSNIDLAMVVSVFFGCLKSRYIWYQMLLRWTGNWFYVCPDSRNSEYTKKTLNCILFFFNGHSHRIRKFPGQGLNWASAVTYAAAAAAMLAPLSHCARNQTHTSTATWATAAGFLTHSATAELRIVYFKWVNHVIYAKKAVINIYNLCKRKSRIHTDINKWTNK